MTAEAEKTRPMSTGEQLARGRYWQNIGDLVKSVIFAGFVLLFGFLLSGASANVQSFVVGAVGVGVIAFVVGLVLLIKAPR